MTYLKSKYMKDTFVISNLPYKKYHLSSLLLIGSLKKEGEVKLAKAIFKFNLDSIKVEMVNKATLKIFVRKKQPYNFKEVIKFNVGINMEYVYISDTCFKSSPQFDQSKEEFIVDRSSIGSYVEVDITDIINDWLSKKIVNNGITIYSQEGRENAIIHFSSTESSRPPILEYEI